MFWRRKNVRKRVMDLDEMVYKIRKYCNIYDYSMEAQLVKDRLDIDLLNNDYEDIADIYLELEEEGYIYDSFL